MRVKITLACTECKQRNYVAKKNKKNDPDRIELNKYCKFCKKHTPAQGKQVSGGHYGKERIRFFGRKKEQEDFI